MTDPRIQVVRTLLTGSDAMRLYKQPFSYPHIHVIADLKYQGDDPSHKLDLYLPKDTSHSFPLIIDIHGGGLVYGNKGLNRWTSAEMAGRGYAVAALDYPLMPHATLIDQLQSLLDALYFIEGLAHPQIDLTRVCLKGDSGGGLQAILLSELIAKRRSSQGMFRIRHSYPIKALALIHPMVHTKRRDILAFIDSHKGEKDRVHPEEWSILSRPGHRLPKELPIWIVTSRNDVMFHKEGSGLAGRLARTGYLVAFEDHPFKIRDPLGHIFMVTQPGRRESQLLYNKLDRFLRKMLWGAQGDPAKGPLIIGGI